MVPTLLKPKILGLKNRLKSAAPTPGHTARDIFIVLFGVLIMYGIYLGTYRALGKIQEYAYLVYLPPAQPIGLILLMLFFMLLLSNCVTALGTLFFGQDLDLILASPITQFRFYWGKFLYVAFSSSWMPITFVAPFLLAFAVHYQAPPEFYLLAPVIIIPYFLLPVAAAFLFACLYTVIVPAERTREMILFTVLCGLAGLFMVVEAISRTSFDSVQEILRLVSTISLARTPWSPSYWVAQCLQKLLLPGSSSVLPELALLYSVAAAAVAGAYLVTAASHQLGYSRARNRRQTLNRRGRRRHIKILDRWLSPPYQAIIGKELRLFFRDITQTVQLLLLVGLCLIYLFNLRIFRAVESLPEPVRLMWQDFPFVSNVAMGSLVTTAICTRFVIHTLSLEGQSYWVLQKSPIALTEILRAKFWYWFLPISLVSAAVLSFGAHTIGASTAMTVITGVTGAVISYGLVSLGIGFGAMFANFQWEHSSELAASFGSLVYIFASTLFIFMNMVPAGFIIYSAGTGGFKNRMSEAEWWILCLSCAYILLYLNALAQRWSFTVGVQALIDRAK